MLTFVRHGVKAYDNGKKIPLFDPHLIPHFQDLPNHSQYHGREEVIVWSSPYRRCRQTADKFADQYFIDGRIGEFLGHWEAKPIEPDRDYHSTTHEYLSECLPPRGESFQAMRARMVEFFIERCRDLRDNQHVIVVSHGLPIQTLMKSISITKPSSSDLPDSKKISLGFVEGFTFRLHERDIIPTRFYSTPDRNWCNDYGWDTSIPIKASTERIIFGPEFRRLEDVPGRNEITEPDRTGSLPEHSEDS